RRLLARSSGSPPPPGSARWSRRCRGLPLHRRSARAQLGSQAVVAESGGKRVRSAFEWSELRRLYEWIPRVPRLAASRREARTDSHHWLRLSAGVALQFRRCSRRRSANLLYRAQTRRIEDVEEGDSRSDRPAVGALRAPSDPPPQKQIVRGSAL